MNQKNRSEKKNEQTEPEESTSSSCLQTVDTSNTPMANNIDLESLDSKAPESFGIIRNPFENLVNGHGHEVNISDESRTSARIFFQQGNYFN